MFYLKSFTEKREVQNFLFLQRLPSNSTFCFQFGATPIGSIPHQCDPTETGDEATLHKINSICHRRSEYGILNSLCMALGSSILKGAVFPSQA